MKICLLAALLGFSFSGCATSSAARADEERVDENTEGDEAEAEEEADESKTTGLLKFDPAAAAAEAANMARAVSEASAACDEEVKDNLSDTQLVELSEQHAQYFIDNTGPVHDEPAAKKELERIAGKLAPGQVLTFTITKSPLTRSSFVSDGQVFLTTGLLKKTANEAQLAAVLAREIKRVQLQADRAPRVRALRAQCSAQKMAALVAPSMQDAFGGAVMGMVHGTSEALLRELSPLSREADLSVPATLAKAGYTPDAYEVLVLSLGDTSLAGVTAEGGATQLAEALKAKREELKLSGGKAPPLPKALTP